jgi:hypothetical protein
MQGHLYPLQIMPPHSKNRPQSSRAFVRYAPSLPVKEKGPRWRSLLNLFGMPGCSSGFRLDRDEFPKSPSILKTDLSRSLCEQRVVSSDSYIRSRLELRSPLANNNRSALNQLAGKAFYSKHLWLTIPPVSGTSNTLFMCHTFLKYR